MSYSFIGKVFPEYKKKEIIQPKLNIHDTNNYITPVAETFIPHIPHNRPVNTHQLPETFQNKTDLSEMSIHLDYILNNELCKEILLKKWGCYTLDDLIWLGFLIILVFYLSKLFHSKA